MPHKPIKHGIKAFAVCCSITAILLGFDVYVGKVTGATLTTIAIVERH